MAKQDQGLSVHNSSRAFSALRLIVYGSIPWKWLFLIFISLFLVGAIVHKYFNSVDPYVASTWLYNYGFGFIPRGLAGTITRLIFGDLSTSYNFINIVSIVLFYTLFGFILLLSALALKKTDDTRSFIVLFILFISSPGTISFLAQDIGRFDSINYIIIIVISFIYILNKSTSGAVALSAGLMSSVAILFHEAFLLIGLPLVLSMHFLGAPPGRSVPVFVTFLIPVLMAVGAVSWLARPNISASELYAIVQKSADFQVSVFTTMLFYLTTLDTTMRTRNFVADNFSISS